MDISPVHVLFPFKTLYGAVSNFANINEYNITFMQMIHYVQHGISEGVAVAGSKSLESEVKMQFG